MQSRKAVVNSDTSSRFLQVSSEVYWGGLGEYKDTPAPR